MWFSSMILGQNHLKAKNPAKQGFRVFDRLILVLNIR